MRRRDLLRSVASSPLLNVVSFDRYSDSEGVELGLKADSKRHSKRIFKYKYTGEGVEEMSTRIYYFENKWLEDVTEAVESMGFIDHCIFDVENTSLVYCAYFTDRDYQTLLYQIEPGFTMVSVHQYDDHIEVAGKRFETTEDALSEIERIKPDKRGDWAL